MDIALLDVLAVGEHGIAFGYDVDVLQADAVDGHLWQTVEFHSATCTIADNILDIDITEDGGFFGDGHLSCVVRIVAIGQHFGHRFASIVHVKGDGISLDIGHRDIVDKDVFDDTATTSCGLEAQTYVSTQELAVLDEDILYATTHL